VKHARHAPLLVTPTLARMFVLYDRVMPIPPEQTRELKDVRETYQLLTSTMVGCTRDQFVAHACVRTESVLRLVDVQVERVPNKPGSRTSQVQCTMVHL
jgi:hypothetical protein